MNIIRKTLSALIIVISISCNNFRSSECKPPNSYEIVSRYGDLLDSSANQVSDSGRATLSDKKIIPNLGGQYSFYETGKLKDYYFYQVQSASRFMEQFDMQGRLIKREGNPILFMKVEEVQPDSLVFNLYISTLTIRPIKSTIIVNENDTLIASATNEISFSSSITYKAGKKIETKGKVDFKANLIYANCSGDNFSASDSGYVFH